MVRHRCRRASLKEDSGQALVEFALVVPIFLLLLLGIVEFARAWNIYEVLTDAGREGARNAVVDNEMNEADVMGIIVAAGERAGIAIDPGNIRILPEPLSGATRGDVVTVRIEYRHELRWVSVLWNFATGEPTINMVSEFSMRKE